MKQRAGQAPWNALLTALLAALITASCGGESADTPAGNDAGSSSGASSSGSSSSGGASGGDAGAEDSGGAVDAGLEDTGPTTPPCKPFKKPGDPDWGCPAGQKCVWGATASECVPAGTKPAGAKCDNPDECAVGICISNAAGDARCSPFCISDVQCTKGPCNGLQSGKGKVCDMGGDPVPQCNPLSQSCAGAQGCFYTPDGFICLSPGGVADGGKCAADNDCKKGSVCVGKSGSSAGICRKVCSTAGGTPKCDLGVNCSKLGGTVGYCDG